MSTFSATIGHLGIVEIPLGLVWEPYFSMGCSFFQGKLVHFPWKNWNSLKNGVPKPALKGRKYSWSNMQHKTLFWFRLISVSPPCTGLPPTPTLC
jgi:hypothetical protein